MAPAAAARGRKAIFFTVDAMMALTIMVIGIALIADRHISEREVGSQLSLTNDIVAVLGELKVGEVNNTYVQELIANGSIEGAALNNSLLEQAAQFWAENEGGLATAMIQNLTLELFPDIGDLSVIVSDDTLYERNSTGKTLVIPMRRIITGIAKDEVTFGYTVRAFLSDITGGDTDVIIYFGGFIGQGDLTFRVELPDFDSANEIYMELAPSSNFTLLINGNFSGDYARSTNDSLTPDNWTMNTSYLAYLQGGTNYLTFNFSNQSEYIAGGYLRISMNSSDASFSEAPFNGTHVTRTQYLPGVTKLINHYLGFFVEGNLTKMELYLNYTSNYPVFAEVGNVTVYASNQTGQVAVTLTDANLSPLLDYGALSRQTVPLRLGHLSAEKLNFSGCEQPSDPILTTEVSTPMRDNKDIVGEPNRTRLDVAIDLDRVFITKTLTCTGSRVGLVGYHNGVPNVLLHDLSDNEFSLHATALNYNQSEAGQVNICWPCALAESRDRLMSQSNGTRNRAVILMSDGFTNRCEPSECGGCGSDESCKINKSKARSIQLACDMVNNTAYNYNFTNNITLYAVGFGNGADNETLRYIAENCSKGKFYTSDNSSGLQDIYDTILSLILGVSFEYQFAVPQGAESSLEADSYIRVVYIPEAAPPGTNVRPFTFESERFGNNVSTGGISFSENSSFLSARVISYSGDLWTEAVSVTSNGTSIVVFNLTSFGSDYTELGDPFVAYVPASAVRNASPWFTVETASAPGNRSGGSPFDRVIYTLTFEGTSGYSGVAGSAEGCTWKVTYEDGTNLTVPIPSGYNGSKVCYLENATYDLEDAIDQSVYQLFRNLDADHDGLLDFAFQAEDLEISTSQVSEVPSLWGPTLTGVKTWQ